MFAFALWDSECQQLYLVRDRMGEKPLYYAPIHRKFQNGIVFASELKGLMKYPFVERHLSMTALNHYLSFNYTATDDAIFEDTYKLPPASYLQYNLQTNEYKVSEYWSLADCFHHSSTPSFKESQAQLKYLLGDSVRGTLISDVPVGAFLSGGVDSAVIVSEMRNSQTSPVNTYSVGFHEKTYSELGASQKTAQYLGAHHQAKIISPDFVDQLQKAIGVFGEPFADTSLIPTYFLCKFAKQFVTVTLSGDGGDELFGGYATYQADRYFRWIQYLPASVRKMLCDLSRYLPTSFGKVSVDYKIKQFLHGSLLDARKAHFCWREVFSENQKKALFHSDYHALLANDPKDKLSRWFHDVSGCHYLNQAMYVDMKTWLLDDILVKVDRASMAHSLEVRSPFLDHRLVEFAASMPIHFKIKQGRGKHILKSAYKNNLPGSVFRQPKKGFNAPISLWLSHALFDMAYEITTSAHLMPWFNQETIKQMWFEHQKGICDNGYRLFNLLCLGLWRQSYLKE